MAERQVDRQTVALLAVVAIIFLVPFGMALYVGQVLMGFGYLALMVAGAVYSVWLMNRNSSK